MYKSAEAEMLGLKHRTYGIDVIVEIGYLRHTEKRSIPEILSFLRRRQIEIAKSECYELLHVFEELIATRPAMLDPDFYDAAINNGGIILAIDGLQPETGNSTLYVLQDTLTEKVLYADYLENSSNENIVPLLEAVKRLGIPVIAVVSDHHHGIRLAVEKVFPGVPHQFCHFHVLRNACLPIIDMDRNLKMEVRKAIRGVSSIEKRLRSKNTTTTEDDDDSSSHLVTFACLLLRSILVYPGTIPLNWGGMCVPEAPMSVPEASGTGQEAQADALLEEERRCRARAPRTNNLTLEGSLASLQEGLPPRQIREGALVDTRIPGYGRGRRGEVAGVPEEGEGKSGKERRTRCPSLQEHGKDPGEPLGRSVSLLP